MHLYRRSIISQDLQLGTFLHCVNPDPLYFPPPYRLREQYSHVQHPEKITALFDLFEAGASTIPLLAEIFECHLIVAPSVR